MDEPFWPAQLTVLVTIALQFTFSSKVTVGPRWLFPGIEAVLLGVLSLATPVRLHHVHQGRRRVALVFTGLVSVINMVSLGLLTHELLHHTVANGRSLIVSGSEIWATNVLIFTLWYWETDRGGPAVRGAARHGNAAEGPPDFLFIQMTADHTVEHWNPNFMDYFYLSFTNATAFSPTDTMPLTGRAKGIMALQALVALITIGLVISRAVNILA
jgi:hypothetical protein